MASVIAGELKQKSAFASREQEVLLGILIASARIIEPWERFLKTQAGLSNEQYNVLRILRGSHPTRLACSEISQRMIARDPDVTRLVDRLSQRGLVSRARAKQDRRSSKSASPTRDARCSRRSTRTSIGCRAPCWVISDRPS